MHINGLELLAATLAVKTLVKDMSNVFVLLKLDSMTAVCYTSLMGGTVSRKPVLLTKQGPVFFSWRPNPLVAAQMPFCSNGEVWQHMQIHLGTWWGGH